MYFSSPYFCFLIRTRVISYFWSVMLFSLKKFQFLFLKTKKFNYSEHSVLFYMSFRCTKQWLDNHILYKVLP